MTYHDYAPHRIVSYRRYQCKLDVYMRILPTDRYACACVVGHLVRLSLPMFS